MNRICAFMAPLALLILMTGDALAADAALEAFKGCSGRIDIAGGTAHIPVMKGAARQIMAYNPDVRITVAGGGSGAGVQKVGEGLAQIGNTGRALRQGEIDKYGLVSFPFAIDGVAVAVNPANPVDGLTRSQLAGIFSGRVKNWREVGGRDAPIAVYAREDGSGTRETFEEKALDGVAPAAGANVVNSNGAMKTAIAGNPDAIGYVGIGHLDDTVRGLKIDGMTPSQEGAANGDYTVTRLLYMNTRGEPTGIVEDFVKYIFSPAGAELIRGAGYIPYVARK